MALLAEPSEGTRSISQSQPAAAGFCKRIPTTGRRSGYPKSHALRKTQTPFTAPAIRGRQSRRSGPFPGSGVGAYPSRRDQLGARPSRRDRGRALRAVPARRCWAAARPAGGARAGRAAGGARCPSGPGTPRRCSRARWRRSATAPASPRHWPPGTCRAAGTGSAAAPRHQGGPRRRRHPRPPLSPCEVGLAPRLRHPGQRQLGAQRPRFRRPHPAGHAEGARLVAHRDDPAKTRRWSAGRARPCGERGGTRSRCRQAGSPTYPPPCHSVYCTTAQGRPRNCGSRRCSTCMKKQSMSTRATTRSRPRDIPPPPPAPAWLSEWLNNRSLCGAESPALACRFAASVLSAWGTPGVVVLHGAVGRARVPAATVRGARVLPVSPCPPKRMRGAASRLPRSSLPWVAGGARPPLPPCPPSRWAASASSWWRRWPSSWTRRPRSGTAWRPSRYRPAGEGGREGQREGGSRAPATRVPRPHGPGRARAWRAGPGVPWGAGSRQQARASGGRVSHGVLRQGWGCRLLPRCVTACTRPGLPSPSSARSSRRSAPSACPAGWSWRRRRRRPSSGTSACRSWSMWSSKSARPVPPSRGRVPACRHPGICACSSTSCPREAHLGRREFVVQQRTVAVLLWIFFFFRKRRRGENAFRQVAKVNSLSCKTRWHHRMKISTLGYQ